MVVMMALPQRQIYIPLVAAILLRRAASFPPNLVNGHYVYRFCSPSRFYRLRSMSQLVSNSNANNNDEVAANEDSTKKTTTLPIVIVQYIFLRRDLAKEWPAGAMAAQAAHASLAAVTQALRANHEPAIQYVSPQNLPHMTKQVYGVDSDIELEMVRQAWRKLMSSTAIMETTTTSSNSAQKDEQEESSGGGGEVGLYVWMEQPENIPTAMATWPVVRNNKVSKVIKNLKLSYF